MTSFADVSLPPEGSTDKLPRARDGEPAGDPLLRVEHLKKSFGPVRVIDDVSLSIYPGKALALLGENGAGKSTVIKMIAGVYQPDSGRILVDGQPAQITTVKDAEGYGIATIHQELNLVPTMSVAENILLGRTPQKVGLVDVKELRRRARESLEIIGLDIDLNTPVGDLGIAQQQLVEIAKALSVHARILILDEPTAALSSKEVDQLFSVLDQLKARGVGMVFISHHLDEIARIADSVSVLRDGHCVANVPPSTSEDEFVRLMVGRDITEQYPKIHTSRGDALLEVKNLSSEGKFSDISLTVHSGEILGIAGLVGAGRTELIRAVAGVDKYDSGSVTVRGKKLPAGDIGAAIRAGIGHVPEDRKAQGLILDADVADNIGLATLFSSGKAGIADQKGQRLRAGDIAEKLRLRMAGLDQAVRDLSGGNQQKAVFARWVMAGSSVLLLDEPTRGVDVGAKVEIYTIINEIVSRGGAVVMVSSDLPEILGMSDRIVVMSGGRIAGELPPTATQDDVMRLAVAPVGSKGN